MATIIQGKMLQQKIISVCEKSSSLRHFYRSSMNANQSQNSRRFIPNHNFTCRKFSSSSGGGKGNKNVPKRPRVGGGTSKNSSNLDGVWYSTSKPPSTKNLDMGKYGLKRLDYNKMEVPVWTVPPHPP